MCVGEEEEEVIFRADCKLWKLVDRRVLLNLHSRLLLAVLCGSLGQVKLPADAKEKLEAALGISCLGAWVLPEAHCL